MPNNDNDFITIRQLKDICEKYNFISAEQLIIEAEHVAAVNYIDLQRKVNQCR